MQFANHLARCEVGVDCCPHDLLGARDGLRRRLDPHPADHSVEGNEFLNVWLVARNGFAVCLRCRGYELLVEIVSPRHFARELVFPRLRPLAQPGRDAGRQAADHRTLLEQLRDELTRRTYQPLPARRQEIPKDGGKVRVLSIPAIRDRVVQGALKLILEPVFEADFQPGSYGYRPKRTAHGAIKRVAEAIVQRKTRVLDFDLRAYFDNVRHDRLLEKVARRVDDADIMHLLKIMLKASGKKGVPQGGVISPLLSNLYLNEADKMLERAREVTRNGKYTYVEYARFADDLVVLIDAYKRHDWLIGAVTKRLREEFAKLQVEINDEKSRTVDLERGESFGFLGFDFRYLRSLRGAMRPHYTPKLKKRTALLRELKEVFRRYRSQPIDRGDKPDQPDAPGVGELLRRWTLQ
jgi:RNA-directed DNA polymerase